MKLLQFCSVKIKSLCGVQYKLKNLYSTVE